MPKFFWSVITAIGSRVSKISFILAIGDFVYEFDSITIDYSKKLFMEVYYEALKGNDIVAATPAGNVEFPVSLFYYFYNKFRLSKGGSQTKLQRETFRIVSRRAINRVQTLGKSVPYRKVMYQNCGLGYKNLVYERTTKDKKNYRDKERKSRENLALDTLLMFTNAVQKVSMFLSMFFLIFTIGVGVYVVAVFFSVQQAADSSASQTIRFSLCSCLLLLYVPPNIKMKYQTLASKLARSAFSFCCCLFFRTAGRRPVCFADYRWLRQLLSMADGRSG